MKRIISAGLAVSLLFGGFSTVTNQPTAKVEAAGYTFTKEQEDALRFYNEIRINMGLKPAKLNPFLIKAAENHANYLKQNNLNFTAGSPNHTETRGKTGFTGVTPEDRVKAAGGGDLSLGTTEVISYNTHTLQSGLSVLINLPLHRRILVDPNISEVGFAVLDGRVVIVPYIDQEYPSKEEAMYPYNGMKDVKLDFLGRTENPNILAKHGLEKSGFVISYTTYLSPDEMSVTVKDSKGKSVPIIIEPYANFWMFIPKSPLASGETYTVSTKYTANTDGTDENPAGEEVTVSKTWSFSTIKTATAPTPPATNYKPQPDACGKYLGVTKVIWDGAELKKGQIGKLTVLKDTPLYKVDGSKKTFSRTLKKGETYRIYAFKEGALGLGGGYFIDRDTRISYTTPSKAKLEAAKCIK